MTGIIVTGHGSFATGITSGLKLLAGELECCEAVDFLPEDSIELLTEKLEAAVKRLGSCEGILILADLTGGSPFNVSLRLKLGSERKIEVIGGTNLPVLLDSYMSRAMISDTTQLAVSSLSNGREQLIRYEAAMAGSRTDNEPEDDDEIECED